MILWFELTRSVRLWSFLGNVSALCWVVLCSMAGALSHALTETRWARPASASQPRSLSASQPLSLRRCSHVCQSPVTPEYRRSKSPVVPTTTQLLHVPNFLLCSTSFTFLHMCFQGWPLILHLCALSGLRDSPEWQLWKLSAVSFRRRVLGSSRRSKRRSLFLSVCLCLFVLFLLNCEKPHSRGGEEASSAIALRGQTVNQRRDNCRWGFHL